MRIEQINLLRYGPFENRLVEFPQATTDLHLVIGENEAGKSTLRKAIVDWVYGFGARTDMNVGYEPALLRIGGVLSGQGERLEFHRRKGNKDTLRTPADGVIPPEALKPFLEGAPDRDFFERMFCLDHGALRAGAQQMIQADGDDRVAQMLFQSAAGIQGLDLLLGRLEGEASELWGPVAKKSRAYDTALAQYKEAKQTLDHAEVRFRKFRELQEAVASAEGRLSDNQQKVTLHRKRLNAVQRILRVALPIEQLRSAERRREQMGEIVRLPADALSRVTNALRMIEEQTRRAMDCENRADAERVNAAMRSTNDRVFEAGPDVDALVADLKHVLTAIAELPRVETEREAALVKLTDAAKQVGWTFESLEAIERLIPSEASRRAAAQMISSLQAEELALKNAEKMLVESRVDFEAAEAAAAGAGNEDDGGLLKSALEGLTQALAGVHSEEVESARLRLARAMDDLRPWIGTPEELASLKLPSTEAVRMAITSFERYRAESQRLDSVRTNAEAKRVVAEAALAEARLNAAGLSEQDLTNSRDQRDARWKMIREGGNVVELAPAYEQSVVASDHLADQRFNQSKQAHELDACVERVAGLQEEIEACLKDQAVLEQSVGEFSAQWSAQMATLGLGDIALADIESWRQKRVAALQRADEHRGKQDEQEKARLLVERAANDVRLLLPNVPADLSPLMMSEAAQREVDRRMRLTGASAGLVKARDVTEIKFKKAEAEHQRCVASLAQSRKAWEEAAATLGLSGKDLFQCRELLDVMNNMTGLLTQVQGYDRRLVPMRETIRLFRERSAQTATRMSLDGTTKDLRSLVDSMMNIVMVERENRAALRQASQREASEEKNAADARSKIAELRAEVGDLLQLAGVTDVADLLRLAQASTEASRIEYEIEGLRANVVKAGDGLTLAQVLDEFDGEDRAQLAVEQKEIEDQVGPLTEEGKLFYADVVAAKAAFEAIGGSAKAAEAESDRQMALSDMQAAMDRYIRVKSGAVILKWALRKFREQAQGPMLEKAGQLFSLMTEGRYTKLDVDYDSAKPTLLAIRAGGASIVRLEGLSEGTRDALYLALRLAAIDLHLKERPSTVIVADDLFINLDDARAAAGFRALAEVSQKAQVLYLTHHHHLADVAHRAIGSRNQIMLSRAA